MSFEVEILNDPTPNQSTVEVRQNTVEVDDGVFASGDVNQETEQSVNGDPSQSSITSQKEATTSEQVTIPEVKLEAVPESDTDLDFLLNPAEATKELLRRESVRKVNQEKTQAAEFTKAQAELEKEHSDARDIITSAEYRKFIESNPAAALSFAEALNRKDGKLAASVVSLFKATQPSGQARNQARSAAEEAAEEASSSTVARQGISPTNSRKIWSRAEVQQLSRSDREKLDDVLQTAYAEGRVR